METLLLQFGVLLFLIGLFTGFAIPKFANLRMGLSSHLEAVLNGIFLMVLGLLWSKLNLSAMWLGITFWLAVYGTFANWLATLLAAIWGAGSMMPIAAQGLQATSGREGVVRFLLVTLGLAMVSTCILILIGLSAG